MAHSFNSFPGQSWSMLPEPTQAQATLGTQARSVNKNLTEHRAALKAVIALSRNSQPGHHTQMPQVHKPSLPSSRHHPLSGFQSSLLLPSSLPRTRIPNLLLQGAFKGKKTFYAPNPKILLFHPPEDDISFSQFT